MLECKSVRSRVGSHWKDWVCQQGTRSYCDTFLHSLVCIDRNVDSSTKFTTRLVSNKGIYSYCRDTPAVNAKLLETAGLLEHVNCIPYLAKSLANNNSKADDSPSK